MKNNVFQIMRGVCIVAVVLTHVIDKKITNPNYEVALIIQNIVNCAVTGFIFLAGYFINIEEVITNTKHFIVKKSQRILIPYILWSIFYILFSIIVSNQSYTLGSLIEIFLLGRVGTLYYCVLYFLFMLLTPFVVKRKDDKKWNIVFYSIMPLWFIIIYLLQIKYQISYTNWGILPFTWFLYFYIGLKWRNISFNLSIFTVFVLICVGYAFELMETYFLLSLTNNTQFSATPIRFSAILYVIPFILLFLNLKNTNHRDNMLVSLGNNSFGIYLFHIIILSCVQYTSRNIFLINTVQYSTIQYIFYILIIFIITMLFTNVLINICKQLIPIKFLKWIGFN